MLFLPDKHMRLKSRPRLELRTPSVSPSPSGWWDPNGDGLSIVAAYEPYGAGSLAESYEDLSGNGNDASLGGGDPGLVAAGWDFDGDGDYINAGVTIQNSDWAVSAITGEMPPDGAASFNWINILIP